MLTHRRKKFGLPDPVNSNRKEHMPKQNHGQKQLVMKNNYLLKMTPIQTSQAAAQGNNEQADGLQCLRSISSQVELLEGEVSDKYMSGSSEYHTDSTISDQEQESIEISTCAAAMELDLKTESFGEDLDHHSTKTAFYPDVVPAALLNSSQSMSSGTQQSIVVADPCLASVITRLIELERLQTATVQKEQTKQARSRPATANTRGGNSLKKSDFKGCKTVISKDVECNSVMCSFTKLMVCSNTSCRCRHHTCFLRKPGQGSRTKLPHPTLTNCPDSMSGKCKKAETLPPNVSVNIKVPQKATMSNRTKSSKTHRGSMSNKKATKTFNKRV
ncbi:hypothetical protein Baya_5046 [Bagarius yarrelli]|uniref:Uncharacterized protein n=1 Tax=Bagarius yarrelli TaxID=175774 RepID=A0A556TV67_BAGYA|nr:hypothetical protein Baya_5046 [Bagarius yarrelli]